MAQRKKKTSVDAKAGDGDKDDEIVILCQPAGVMPGVPGSRRLECTKCRQMVWLSPATEQRVAGKPYKVMCDECVSLEVDDDVQLMPVAEGQIAEMMASIPGITRAEILKNFPSRSPKRRKAAFDAILKEARKRRRSKN